MEIFDIVDERGEPTGETVERVFAHANGIRHRTAHVWLFRVKGETVEVLLQKRSADKDSFPGCYDISSAGHIPAGMDYIPSALRELREELGLSVEPDKLIYCGRKSVETQEIFHGNPFHDRQVTRVYALWYTPELGEIRVQEEEIESVLWISFQSCVDGVQKGSFRNCIDYDELMMLASVVEEKMPRPCLKNRFEIV